jgi:hypothetical protein
MIVPAVQYTWPNLEEKMSVGTVLARSGVQQDGLGEIAMRRGHSVDGVARFLGEHGGRRPAREFRGHTTG